MQYRHYKGGAYTLLHVGKMEENGQEMAVYEAVNGEIWIRPLSEFNEKFTPIEQEPPKLAISISFEELPDSAHFFEAIEQ